MSSPNITYSPGIDKWLVKEDFQVNIDGYNLTVPRGFKTDLASIPWLLRGITNTYQLGITGPVVHDYCYVKKGLIDDYGSKITRQQSDRFFAALMFNEHVPIWRINAAYYAVRVFGRIWWKE